MKAKKICLGAWITTLFIFFTLLFIPSLVLAGGQDEKTPPQKPISPQMPSSTTSKGGTHSTLPDLRVSEISEDDGIIIVKIKNSGLGSLQESDYGSAAQGRVKIAMVELKIDGVRFTERLATIDSGRALTRPGGEVAWNTGKQVWKGMLDNRTEVLATVDVGNLIEEANENNNTLRKVFSRQQRVASRVTSGVDLQIVDISGPNVDCQDSIYRYHLEIRNNGREGFQGEIYFDIWVKRDLRWEQLKEGETLLVNNSRVMIAFGVDSESDRRCRNITLPPGERMMTSDPHCRCSAVGAFYIVRRGACDTQDQNSIEVKAVLRTANNQEYTGNNEIRKTFSLR